MTFGTSHQTVIVMQGMCTNLAPGCYMRQSFHLSSRMQAVRVCPTTDSLPRMQEAVRVCLMTDSLPCMQAIAK